MQNESAPASTGVKDVMITSSIGHLRDPFVFVDNGVYYMYGTGWTYSENTTGNLASGWSEMKNAVTGPDHRLYLTCHSPNDATEERGCTPIFLPIRDMGDTLVIDTQNAEKAF